MYILVVSIFDGVLGLSLLITLSALLSMEGVKGKVYFRCRSRRCSLGAWGVDIEDTLIALSSLSFSCVVDVDLLLVETSYSVCSMLFVCSYLFPLS